MPMITIYTDSSYNEANQVAGIGCVAIEGEKRRIFSTYHKLSSNNEGELFAIWYALLIYPNKPVKVYTDSQTAISYINGNVREDKPLTLKQRENRARLRILAYKINQLRKNNPSFQIEHIKAHTNRYQVHYIQNQIADLLAKEGIAKFFASQKVALTIHKNCIKTK